MFYLVLVVFLLVGGALTALAIQNMAMPVHMTLVVWQTPEIPLGLLLVLFFMLGALVLYLVSTMSALHDRKEAKKLEERVQELEQQLSTRPANGAFAPMPMPGGGVPTSSGPVAATSGPMRTPSGPIPAANGAVPTSSGPVPATNGAMPMQNGSGAGSNTLRVRARMVGLPQNGEIGGAPQNGGYAAPGAMPGMMGPQQIGGYGMQEMSPRQDGRYGPQEMSPRQNGGYGMQAMNPWQNGGYGPQEMSPGQNVGYGPQEMGPWQNNGFSVPEPRQ